MPKLAPDIAPSYRLHKQSGQAIVTLSGRDFLLGRYRSPASREEYDRRTAEWLANGRRLTIAGPDLTIVELIAAFLRHAKDFYRLPDGTPSGECDNFRPALALLRRLYGRTAVKDFGPLALKTGARRDAQATRFDAHRKRQGPRAPRLGAYFRQPADREA
jgi:hypothetical protein